MLIDAPLELFHEYTQRMMAWLLLVEPESVKQRQAMQLGLGAVSLTKFCHKKLGMQTTAIELNRQVLHACRGWFRLPADNRRLQVILNDAALEIQDARWWGAVDSLQVDLYDDEAAAPVLDSLPFYNGVLRSGKCFCSSLTPERCGNYTGHHSRYVPRSIWWPPRHAALAPMALACASRFIGLSHRSHGSGCARLRFG